MGDAKKQAGYAVGDVVTWKSQAGGNVKQKTGTVVEVVPAGERPSRSTSTRPHESYVVQVTFEPKRSRSAVKNVRQKKPELYWPVVKNLVLVTKAKQTKRAPRETSSGEHSVWCNADPKTPPTPGRGGCSCPTAADHEAFASGGLPDSATRSVRPSASETQNVPDLAFDEHAVAGACHDSSSLN